MTIIFGIRAKKQEISSVAETLAETHGVKFDLHDSIVRGGSYYRAEGPEGEMNLQGNEDERPEDGPPIPGWPIDQLVLYLHEEDVYSWQKAIHALETTRQIDVVRLTC